jgi:hypothetical protein
VFLAAQLHVKNSCSNRTQEKPQQSLLDCGLQRSLKRIREQTLCLHPDIAHSAPAAACATQPLHGSRSSHWRC